MIADHGLDGIARVEGQGGREPGLDVSDEAVLGHSDAVDFQRGVAGISVAEASVLVIGRATYLKECKVEPVSRNREAQNRSGVITFQADVSGLDAIGTDAANVLHDRGLTVEIIVPPCKDGRGEGAGTSRKRISRDVSVRPRPVRIARNREVCRRIP